MARPQSAVATLVFHGRCGSVTVGQPLHAIQYCTLPLHGSVFQNDLVFCALVEKGLISPVLGGLFYAIVTAYYPSWFQKATAFVIDGIGLYHAPGPEATPIPSFHI